MDSPQAKAPKWFVVGAAVALVWNLLGVMAFIVQITMSAEAIAALSEAEQGLLAATPVWANVAFGVAVWGGALGSLLLLLKSRWAVHTFAASLVGILVQMANSFMIGAFDVYGPGSAIMPTLVVIVGFGLVWLARRAEREGWIS